MSDAKKVVVQLPGMAKGLMLSEGSDTVHWRVMGRDSESGRMAFSEIRGFKIRLTEGDPAAGDEFPGEEDVEQGDLAPLDQ